MRQDGIFPLRFFQVVGTSTRESYSQPVVVPPYSSTSVRYLSEGTARVFFKSARWSGTGRRATKNRSQVASTLFCEVPLVYKSQDMQAAQYKVPVHSTQ